MSCFILFHKLWYHHLSWCLISQALDGAVTNVSPFPPTSEKSCGKRMYPVERCGSLWTSLWSLSCLILKTTLMKTVFLDHALFINKDYDFQRQRNCAIPTAAGAVYMNSRSQDILCESRKNGAPWSCCCCSVARSCPTLCNPMDWSTPGFPILHYLPKFAHTHVRWVKDAIQQSHPLLPPRVEQYTNLWRNKEASLRFISWKVTDHTDLTVCFLAFILSQDAFWQLRSVDYF